MEPLKGLYDPGVEGTAPLLEQTPVGDLVREGVLEGVDHVGEEASLVEKLGGLQMRQAVV